MLSASAPAGERLISSIERRDYETRVDLSVLPTYCRLLFCDRRIRYVSMAERDLCLAENASSGILSRFTARDIHSLDAINSDVTAVA